MPAEGVAAPALAAGLGGKLKSPVPTVGVLVAAVGPILVAPTCAVVVVLGQLKNNDDK